MNFREAFVDELEKIAVAWREKSLGRKELNRIAEPYYKAFRKGGVYHYPYAPDVKVTKADRAAMKKKIVTTPNEWERVQDFKRALRGEGRPSIEDALHNMPEREAEKAIRRLPERLRPSWAKRLLKEVSVKTAPAAPSHLSIPIQRSSSSLLRRAVKFIR